MYISCTQLGDEYWSTKSMLHFLEVESLLVSVEEEIALFASAFLKRDLG